jgi:hypothetical protein
MDNGSKDLFYDWDSLFRSGNLEVTSKNRPRGARANSKKKLDRLKERDVIKDWKEEGSGVLITPKIQNKT